MPPHAQHRPARLVALDWMLEQADRGEHESDGPNRSPLIDKINRWARTPLGSPYCANAGRYAFHIAGVDDFGGPSGASVGFLDEWAAQHGYRVTRPLAGDGFCWKIDGDNWPDHFGMVVRIRSWGGILFTVETVEANTSSGNVGSQADGGGWYRRRRTFVRGRVDFVRDPRPARHDPFRHKVSRKPGWLARAEKAAPLWAWIIWRDHGAHKQLRPRNVPKRIPPWWWIRWRLHHRARVRAHVKAKAAR